MRYVAMESTLMDYWSHGVWEPFYIPESAPVTGWRVSALGRRTLHGDDYTIGGLSGTGWSKAHCILGGSHETPSPHCECGWRISRSADTVRRYQQAVTALTGKGIASRHQWASDNNAGHALLVRVEGFGRAVHNDVHTRYDESQLGPDNTLSVEFMRATGPVFAGDREVAYRLRKHLGVEVRAVGSFDQAVRLARDLSGRDEHADLRRAELDRVLNMDYS